MTRLLPTATSAHPAWAGLLLTLGLALGLTLGSAGSAHAAAQRSTLRNGDYIAVVVNQEVVTAGEIERRVQQAIAAAGPGAKLPPMDELRRQATDALIDERVMLSNARESGMKVDDADVDRAVQSIAAQNQISLATLRQRLAAEGTDYARFREHIRDQLMIERLREREVVQRIKISDQDIDAYLAKQRAEALGDAPTDIAQILITVPEGADAATVAARRAVAQAALDRVLKGEDFATVAREVSEDGNRKAGGEIGLRPASRLPDAFVEATKNLKNGQIAPTLLRSDAGFHVLKLIERKTPQIDEVTQTHVRHILLRTSPELTTAVAERRLAEYRAEIESGKATFGDIARKYSEDGSAAAGGDLGWASPGTMVPEFEAAMNALPIGGLSQPVVSRFGVHLIQVLDRREVALQPRQLREQARNALREQKFEQAYLDWTKELRAQAYVEYREPPQ
ncbi:MAG: peptidylprolyl isomerase [Burkholderiales bacterium]|nr:peptidylprolyl isomerase [Burkholderiales bacterium]MDE2276718.1 peptidylprolyl isomerase [Burkholderiales bacterium]